MFSTYPSFFRLMIVPELALTIMTISQSLTKKVILLCQVEEVSMADRRHHWQDKGLDRRLSQPTVVSLAGRGYIYLPFSEHAGL